MRAIKDVPFFLTKRQGILFASECTAKVKAKLYLFFIYYFFFIRVYAILVHCVCFMGESR